MDANGLRNFGLALDTPTQPGGLHRWPIGPENARVDTLEPAPQHLLEGVRLASAAAPLALAETAVDPDAAPQALALRDVFGHALVWQQAGQQLLSLAARPAGAIDATAPAPVPVVTGLALLHDMAMTSSDVVALAGGTLTLLDTRARFTQQTVALPAGFSARRLAADPDGGLYVLDTTTQRLLHLAGEPLPKTGLRNSRSADSFNAKVLNPDALALREFGGATLPAGEQAIDIACNARGLLLLLTRGADGAQLRVLTEGGAWSDALRLLRPALPYSLGWLDDERFALLTRATVLAADGTPQPERDPGAFDFVLAADVQQGLRQHGVAPAVALTPSGEYHPLTEHLDVPLVRSAAALVADGSGGARLFYARRSSRPGLLLEPAPLARLSGATRATYGLLANSPRRGEGDAARRVRAEPGVVDTGELTTAWHRLYVEACVPRNTALVVWLAANDGAAPPFRPWTPGSAVPSRSGWFPHVVGHPAALPAAVQAALGGDAPRMAWLHEASEVPQGRSLLGCAREPGETGLFTVLIQRAGLAVRTLAGRRLWATVEFFGDGRTSPELVALRAYAGRVSYRDRHLPALYREQTFGPEADMPGRATGADFLERFIDLFEGLFTGIEDRIAQAYRLTDALSAPPEALPWLASWIGLALAPGVAAPRARRMIAHAPQLARQHGTLAGFRLALDIATDGAVTRGRVVVVEDFRLRRTMATILGARLDDHDDPLVGSLARSGNSRVGDTLLLGDEDVKTFLALFRELRVDPQAGNAVQQRQADEREAALHALYDGLAWRVTVLVHDGIDDDEQRLVRSVAEAFAPAHVRVRTVAARYPFLAAVASLVGADTWLREPEPPQPVRVDRSRLGYLDTLQGLGTLDARGGAFGAA